MGHRARLVVLGVLALLTCLRVSYSLSGAIRDHRLFDIVFGL